MFILVKTTDNRQHALNVDDIAHIYQDEDDAFSYIIMGCGEDTIQLEVSESPAELSRLINMTERSIIGRFN